MIQEEGFNDVLEAVGINLSVILERFEELEEGWVLIERVACPEGLKEAYRAMPSPALIEAASTVVYTAPFVNSRGILTCQRLSCEAEPLLDLDTVRHFLLQHLGQEFARSVMNNRDGYVPKRVLQAMSLPVPSGYHLDYVLRDICKNYGISWSPDPPPRDFMLVPSICYSHAVLFFLV